MPDRVALCILSDAYTVQYERDTGWLTLFLGGGPRRNFSPVSIQKLGTFLIMAANEPQEEERKLILDNEYTPNRPALYNQHASHYTAKYREECLALSFDAEQMEFSAESTRLLREFLEKELKSEEAQ